MIRAPIYYFLMQYIAMIFWYHIKLINLQSLLLQILLTEYLYVFEMVQSSYHMILLFKKAGNAYKTSKLYFYVLNSIVKVFSTVGIRAFKYTWYKRFFQKRSKRINVWSHKSSIFTFRLKETNAILFEYHVGYSIQ